MQSSGLGGLQPNTVLLAYPGNYADNSMKCE